MTNDEGKDVRVCNKKGTRQGLRTDFCFNSTNQRPKVIDNGRKKKKKNLFTP